MRFGLTFTVLLFLFAAGPGCESPLGPGDCEESVIVTVSQESGTVITWEPSCSVDIILVSALDDSARVVTMPAWEVNFDDEAVFPPVTYGTAPAGTKVVIDAIPLEPGRSYRIGLFRISGISTIAIGARDFAFMPPAL